MLTIFCVIFNYFCVSNLRHLFFVSTHFVLNTFPCVLLLPARLTRILCLHSDTGPTWKPFNSPPSPSQPRIYIHGCCGTSLSLRAPRLCGVSRLLRRRPRRLTGTSPVTSHRSLVSNLVTSPSFPFHTLFSDFTTCSGNIQTSQFVRKSCAGLSMALFVFAFLGNLFYVLGILATPFDAPEKRTAFLKVRSLSGEFGW